MSASLPNRSAPRAARFLALSIGLAAALLAGEGALRASGRYTTYSERNYRSYQEVYGRRMPSWLLTWEPNSIHRFETSEFAYEYAINADGVRDVPHQLEPAVGRPRVVVLGDSYAEGVGAEHEESWPVRMAARIEQAGLPVEVFNAGRSGSDPCFEYQLLRQRFLRYRPDLVVLAINGSDLTDTLWWGGLERFRPDGTTQGLPRPLSFWFYRRSHLARWFLHTFCGLDRNRLAYGTPARLAWDAQLQLLEICQAFSDLRKQQPFDLLVVVHPMPNGLRWRQSDYYQAFFDRLTERGIASFDATQPLCDALEGQALDQIAWPVDCHFNARGYDALAEVLAPVVSARLRDATAADLGH